MQGAILNQGKTRAAIMIQRHIKGYMVFRNYERMLINCRLDSNAQFFKDMLNKLYTDAQILIAWAWRRHKRKRSRRRRGKALHSVKGGHHAENKANDSVFSSGGASSPNRKVALQNPRKPR